MVLWESYRHASEGKGQGSGCQGKGQGSLAGKAKAQSAGLTKGTDSPGPRLWPREDEYTPAGMLTITTMKSPWRPLASLLKAICSVPYITSHPASEAA